MAVALSRGRWDTATCCRHCSTAILSWVLRASHCHHYSLPSTELPAKVPGCEEGENIPVPGQEANQHFLLHQLQAASWGVIWENNGPFLPLK